MPIAMNIDWSEFVFHVLSGKVDFRKEWSLIVMNTALLLSGGVGSRISSEAPKQYIRINGKMLITYSLEILITSCHIDEIQIVAEHEWREYIIADCKEQGIRTDKIKGFAIPGFSRQASILNGLQNILREKNGQVDINNIEEDNVLIHDVSRPLVSIQQIHDCFVKLSEGYDGVMSFYLENDENREIELIDKKIFSGQAPELFNLKKYYQANIALMPDKIKDVKNSAAPAVMAGMNLAVILGDKNNFTITTQADLDRFAHMAGGKIL